MFKVFKTEEYGKMFDKSDRKEQYILESFERNVSERPYIGKTLGYDFFREKKFNGKRVLFLVYFELSAILLLLITDKDAQQADIDCIKAKFGYYKEIMMKRLA